MEFVLDLHCHTIASGHAYSTILELADFASKNHLQLIAMTDHGPTMPAGANLLHFNNLKVIPQFLKGVEILKGAEVNILNHQGKLDIPEEILSRLDFVIASFHNQCIEPGSAKENTKTLIELMEKPYIQMIGHPGNPSYPVEVKALVRAAKETNTLLELNNSSLKPDSFRKGSRENCQEILKEALKQGARLALGSDAHFAHHLGHFPHVEAMFEGLSVPEELIVNTSTQALKEFIRRKKPSQID